MTSEGITVSPNGKFMYVPVEGGILGFAVDVSTGALTSISGSPFSVISGSQLFIDPSGQFVYSPVGAGITAMSIDGSTGALSILPGPPFQAVASLTAPGALAIIKAQ